MQFETDSGSRLIQPSTSRRRFLQGGAGAAMLASGLLPMKASAASGLVALVHTQAAGDAGPVDSMITKLKLLAGEQGFEYRTIYAQDPATYETIFRTLGDAGAAVVVSTFNEITEPFKAVAPNYPDTKWVQLFGDPMEPFPFCPYRATGEGPLSVASSFWLRGPGTEA